MEKERFLFLLNNQGSLSQEETNEIAIIQAEFPYSQVIHNLAARGAQLNNLPNRQAQLNTAAVYSTDRSVLKTFITSPVVARKVVVAETQVQAVKSPSTNQSKKTIAESPPIAEVTSPADTLVPHVELSGDALLDEVFHDLERLKKLKHDFEVVADGFELPTNALKEDSVHSSTPKKEKFTRTADPESSDNEGLIAEIKSTKKKIKPSDPRQKEQLDIIEQFIKAKPIIPKGSLASKKSEPATDLAESSSVFSENVVSETLVEILIKQGKKEKAVEVLRKLIWKFPQKKAYFAAQIEELTR